MDKPTYISQDAFAEMFSISKQTVYKLRRTGIIPYYRIGGQIRFDLSDVLEYARKQKRDGKYDNGAD